MSLQHVTSWGWCLWEREVGVWPGGGGIMPTMSGALPPISVLLYLPLSVRRDLGLKSGH